MKTRPELTIKRLFFHSLLLFILFSSLVSAQETRFGVKAGPSYSSIVGDLTDGLKFRFSGHLGVFLEVDLSYKFKFQPELVYSSQGFQFSSDLASIQTGAPVAGENDFRTNVQLNYLTIPLIGKFALNENITVDFGPQFGFLLNQVTIIKNLDEIDGTDLARRTSISGDFQLDYGAAVGLGIRLNDNFSLSPRAYIGLRNRLNGLGGNVQNYNAAIQLSVDYLF
ncbi:porin family protein [Croceitalea vernalis]|uniref:Porin family protein n=1 Tax=Croceitalea vernalis TaxID=3075599 RepID=A0ABU3BEK0_9FLAO|nr:porin family protein [Croceitalea sp. P007]MDT0620592.1 porin family protein [Croceitalea sp. P007]